MKARFAYPLVFAVPGALVALFTGVLAAGAGVGILWLFVYGDDPWPEAAGRMVMACAAVVAVAMFALLAWAGYAFGKRRERAGGLSRRHLVLALAASILLPALALLHQWQVGNIGLP